MKPFYLPKYEQLKLIEAQRVLPILHGDDEAVLWQRIAACAAGGLNVLEYTNRSPDALQTFMRLRAFVKAEFPEVVLGAGTITDAPSAALFVHAGAQFVVAPNFDTGVAQFCHKRKMLYIPGCATVNEVIAAEAAGCDLIKWFPGGSPHNAAVIKQLLGPLPHANFIVTGGVKPEREHLQAWFDAGAVAVGIGASFLPASLSAEEMRERVQQLVDLVKEMEAH